jgi:hypothetical protein
MRTVNGIGPLPDGVVETRTGISRAPRRPDTLRCPANISGPEGIHDASAVPHAIHGERSSQKHHK